MKRIYISQSRGYGWLLTLLGWDLIIRRATPGEQWRTKPPAAKKRGEPLLEEGE